MKLPERMKESRYFSSLFLYFSTLIAVILLAVSYILYVNFENIEQKKIFSYSEESLSQISSTADAMLENAKMAIAQIYLDRDMPKVFYQSEADPVELKTITDRINLIGSMPFLQSAYLYNGKLDLYYTSTHGLQESAYFSDQGIVDIMKTYKPEMNLKPITRTVVNSTSNSGSMNYNVYTFVFYENGNAIILNISDSWMKKSIVSMDKKKNGGILILDSAGVLVSSIYQDQIFDDLSHQEFVQNILHSGEKSGHFIGEVDGVKSLVTYASSDALDWKFVRYTPYKEAVKEVDKMRERTLQLCLLLIFVGLALSYVTSRRLNRPVANMLKTLQSQHQVIRENSYQVKQDFLRNLVQSDSIPPQGSLKKRFEQFQIGLNPDAPLRLCILKIDHYEDFSRQYNFKDRNLLRFGIMNISSEMLSVHAPCESVDLGDDHAVVVFGSGTSSPQRLEAELDTIIRDIQMQIRKHFKLTVTAAVSTWGTDISNIRQLYADALEAAQFRVFYGWESLIYAERTAELMCRTFRYPMHAEEQLTDALMLGKMDEVKSLCLSILDSTEGHSFKDLNLTVFRLFFAVNMVVDTLEKASGYSFGIHFNELFAQLTGLERLEDMKARFLELFQHIGEKLGEKKSAKYEELMRKIYHIIDTDYMKEDLCLDSIADILNMSPVYLGRLVKKYTSRSVADYIQEVRIDKASHMLAASDMLIADIAKETGFASNSYFGKVFKKHYGVTPNEYRQKTKSAM